MKDLRILCIYSTRDRSVIDLHPADVFTEHEVTVANTYCEAITALNSGTVFDVIMCDLYIARISSIVAPALEKYSKYIHNHPKSQKAKGFALFLPHDMCPSGFGVSIPRTHAFIACSQSRTITGARDWLSLLNRILMKIKDQPEFFRSMTHETPGHVG